MSQAEMSEQAEQAEKLNEFVREPQPEAFLVAGTEIHGMTQEQFESMRLFLDVLRGDDWLARHLSSLLRYGRNHAVTPDVVIQGMAEECIQFSYNVDLARQLLKKHPELFREESPQEDKRTKTVT